MFSLGLATLHLFTGNLPYEELMEEIKCPQPLIEALASVWENEEGTQGGSSSSCTYNLVNRIIYSYSDADDESDEENIDSQNEKDSNCETKRDLTLFDTFYRYLVLFGLPTKKERENFWPNNPIWTAVVPLLEAEGKKVPRNRSKKTQAVSSTRCCFAADQSMFSLRYGQNPFIKRGRQRLEEIIYESVESETNGTISTKNGVDTLMSMIHFDPSQRITFEELLFSPFFNSMYALDKIDIEEKERIDGKDDILRFVYE